MPQTKEEEIQEIASPATRPVREEHLDRYARLLVEFGVGLRQRQPLFVNGGVIHRGLARRIVRAAREVGAGEVDVRLTDPLEEAQLIASQNRQLIDWYHQRQRRRYREILRTGGASITLAGLEFPDFVRGLAGEHPRGYRWFSHAKLDAYRVFQEGVVHRRQCPWTLAAGLDSEWARRMFPEEASGRAFARLAEIVLRATFADREDAFDRAAAHRRRLLRRQLALDALAIRELRITGGGNDLRVGLSEKARWVSAHQSTVKGQRFWCNVPSAEVYTTPDARVTAGRLVASGPFRTASGLYVEGLVLEFRHGRVVDFAAGEGEEGFGEWLEVDDGACRLGEIALVGEDAPLAQSGLFFDLLLLDENASAHVALGDGYTTALGGGETLSARELAAAGCNRSRTHTDILFGSPAVSVVATRCREGEVVLLDHGRWSTQG